MYRKGIELEWWCWTRESVSDIVLDTRNKIRNDTELGDMDSPCTRKTVKNETMSEVVSGEGGKKERGKERELLSQMPYNQTTHFPSGNSIFPSFQLLTP